MAIANAFSARDSDPILKSKTDTTHAGKPYGFLIPKRGGTLLFKTAEPHGVGERIPDGLGCENVTMTGKKIDSLVELGKILEDAGLPNLGLKKERLLKAGLQPIEVLKNGTRYCALLELVLRYMDIKKVNGKKWFFRPISAKYAGQRMKFVSTKKTSSNATSVKPTTKKKEAVAESKVSEVVPVKKESQAVAPSLAKKQVLLPPKPLAVEEESDEEAEEEDSENESEKEEKVPVPSSSKKQVFLPSKPLPATTNQKTSQRRKILGPTTATTTKPKE
jgi:hypothetical protein